MGKTVLLGAVREAVEAERMLAIAIEAPENRSLPALIVDELHYVARISWAALISTLHWANQLRLPVTVVDAGLPQLLGRMGRAKSYRTPVRVRQLWAARPGGGCRCHPSADRT